MGEAIGLGNFTNQANKEFKKPIIFTALPLEGKDVAYLGPRKTDDSPQATFNYGDGKYVVQFHYIKSDKAAERGGKPCSKTDSNDKKEPITEGTDSDEGYGDQYNI